MARTAKHRISPWCHLPHREAFVNARWHFIFQRHGSCASSQTQSLRSHSTMAMLIFGAQLIPYTLCFWISWYCTRWLWLFLYTAASLWENDYARTMCKSMPVVFRRAQTHGVALALGSQSYWPARNEYIYIRGLCVCPSPVCACDAENARCGVGRMLLKPACDGEWLHFWYAPATSIVVMRLQKSRIVALAWSSIIVYCVLVIAKEAHVGL